MNWLALKVGLLNLYNLTSVPSHQSAMACYDIVVKFNLSLSWAWPSSAPACLEFKQMFVATQGQLIFVEQNLLFLVPLEKRYVIIINFP